MLALACHTASTKPELSQYYYPAEYMFDFFERSNEYVRCRLMKVVDMFSSGR